MRGDADELELVRVAFDAIGLYVVVTDAEGRVLHVNRAVEKALGVSPTECPRHIWELAALAEERGLLRAAYAGPGERFPTGFLFHLSTPGSSPRVVDWSASRIRRELFGQVVVLAGVDLSERIRAQDRLRETEMRQRLLFEQLPAVVWTTNRELRFTSSAGAGLSQLGLEPGQTALVGTSLFHYFHTSDPAHPAIAGHLRALAGERVTFTFTFHDRTFQTCVEPLVEADGSCVGTVGIALDITERIEGENAVRIAEARLRRIVDSNMIGIVFWDEPGSIKDANQAFLDLLGFTSEDLRAGRISWRDLTPSEFHDDDERALRELASKGTCTPYEKEFLRKDGSHVPILIGGATMNGGGAFEGVAFVVDLTDQARLRAGERLARKEAEEANARILLLSEASKVLTASLQVGQTLENLAKVVVPALADWSFVVLKETEQRPRSAASAHGDPANAKLLQRLHDRLPDREAPNAAAHVFRTAEVVVYSDITSDQLSPDATDWPLAGTRNPEDLQIIRSLGMRSLLCVPIRGRNGVEAVMMLVSASDPHRYGFDQVVLAEEIAARAAVALENGALLTEALDAVRARDTFLSVAAHELRTPLTSMLLRVQIMRRTIETDKLDAALLATGLAATEQQVQRLSQLITSLLDVSRFTLAEGQPAAETKEVDLAQLAREGVATMAATVSQARCVVELDAPLPVLGRWDQPRMEQVITNLLSNAVKFGAGRPIQVSVTADRNRARLSVRDHGIGISKEDQARIFGRYERAVSVRNFGGLGLGLYITAEIVRSHGGTIHVESEPGKGACFVVELPG